MVRRCWLALALICAISCFPAFAGFITLNVNCATCGSVTYSAASGINNNGDVVGYFANGSSQYYGFSYHNGVYTPIFVSGADYVFPQGINDNGDIVGRYYQGGEYYGFLLPNGGTLTSFSIAPGSNTMLMGINNSGVMVGQFGNGAAMSGFSWDGANLITVQADGRQTNFSDINNSGVIAGNYYLPSWTGIIRFADGSLFYPVPHPAPGNYYGDIGGINDNGITVGVYISGGQYHPYMYNINSNTYGLLPDMPGAMTTWASGINNSGYVVGYYTNPDGTYHAFEFVPEPSTLLLLAGACLLLLPRLRSRS